MPKPKVDKEKCIGCGTCASIAGKTFKMNDENKCEVYNETGDDPDTIRMACDACPVMAITLEE